MERLTLAVQGMSCAHCVAAVTEEINALPGVTSVMVDLERGTATVAGHVSVDDVAAAVAEAGYELVRG